MATDSVFCTISKVKDAAMKVGDLVRYRGWQKPKDEFQYNSSLPPLALVIEECSAVSEFHRKIRVAWIGEEIPVQASILSTTKSRITTWVSPKYFEVISESDDKASSDK